MKLSTTDQIKGAFDRLKGSVKKKVGELTGKPRSEAEGQSASTKAKPGS